MTNHPISHGNTIIVKHLLEERRRLVRLPIAVVTKLSKIIDRAKIDALSSIQISLPRLLGICVIQTIEQQGLLPASHACGCWAY